MKVKLSEYISQFLVEHEIKDCFMVTGGGAMHLDDALGHQKGLKCTFNHHEQACAIAAEAYTRATGQLAAVCVTSGPGGTNAITGVMGGWLDSIPMFVLSGQVKRETTVLACPDLGLRQLGDQEFDIVHSVSNMTKYCVMVTEPNDVAYHLEKALFLAKDGRGGPVWLDIPLDVQGAQIEVEKLKHFDKSEYKHSDYARTAASVAKEVLEKIKTAKAPLMLVGTGVRLGRAEKEILALVEKLKIPVVTAWNANDLIPYESEFFAGMPGTVGTRAGNFALQNCDLLLSLACRMNIRMIGYNKFDFAKNAYKIAVDIDEKELKKPTLKIDFPVCCDVKDFAASLLKENYFSPAYHSKWREWCRTLVEKYPVTEKKYYGSETLNPYVFIDGLFNQLKGDDRIICGNGSACVITFQAGKIKVGQRMFTNSGCAAMGYGLPAAVGVAVSDNSRRTVCIDGDGSIMMNLQELATVSYNRLNIKIFVINNNGYSSIRQTQTNLFKPPFIGIDQDSGLSFPDFRKLAGAFGLKYYKISDGIKYLETIQNALNCDGACVCEVVVDSKQNFAPKSSSRVLDDGRIVSPSLDDMAPFLPRDEYESVKYFKSEE